MFNARSCSVSYTVNGITYGTDFYNTKIQKDNGVEKPITSISWIAEVNKQSD